MFPNLVAATSQRWIVMFTIADEMKFTNPARLPVYQIPIRRRKPRLAFFGQPLAARVNTSYTRVVTAKPCYEKSQLTVLRSGKNSPPVLSPVAFPQPLLDTRAFDRRASETWPCLLACRVEALLMQKAVDIERANLGQERPRSLRLLRQAITA
jgi:hypothetical protein